MDYALYGTKRGPALRKLQLDPYRQGRSMTVTPVIQEVLFAVHHWEASKYDIPYLSC
jgi:hypothetical protein